LEAEGEVVRQELAEVRRAAEAERAELAHLWSALKDKSVLETEEFELAESRIREQELEEQLAKIKIHEQELVHQLDEGKVKEKELELQMSKKGEEVEALQLKIKQARKQM